MSRTFRLIILVVIMAFGAIGITNQAAVATTVTPAGTSEYTLNGGQSVTLNAPSGVTPADAPYQYYLDGVATDLGTYDLDFGTRVLVLKVNGETVDTDEIQIEGLADVVVTGGCRSFTVTINDASAGLFRFGNAATGQYRDVKFRNRPGQVLKIKTNLSEVFWQVFTFVEGNYADGTVAVNQDCGGKPSKSAPKRLR